MTQQFDLAASLARGVADRVGAWEFVRGFAADWGRSLEPGDGWPETGLAEAERELGIRLPAALREAYLLFGRRGDPTGRHEVLLSPGELRPDPDGKALVFRRDGDGASWGLLLDDLRDGDPPVFVRADPVDGTAGPWEPWLARLSLCLVEMVLSAALDADRRLCDSLDPDDRQLGLLEENLPAGLTGR
jgi:hypothetical protein